MFNEILGHKDVKKRMVTLIESNSIRGSFLFHGPPSVGKRTIAFEVARCVLCLGDRLENCLCESCKQFKGGHPDFVSVGVQERIKVSNIDDILSFSFKVPFLSNCKVAIVDNADNITRAAANKLLKVVEEPPSYMSFILITSDPTRVLDTLRGRCIQIPYGNLSEENVINVLYQKLGFSASEARVLGWIASGSSIDIFPKAGMYLKQRNKAWEFIERLKNSSLIDLLDFLSEIEKMELPPFIDMFVLLLSDMVLLMNEYDRIVNMDMRDQLQRMSKKFNPKGILASTNMLSQVKRYGYLNINLGNVLRNSLIQSYPYFQA